MTKNILCGIYVTLSNNSQNFTVQVICFGLPIVTIILLQVSKTFQIQLHLKHSLMKLFIFGVFIIGRSSWPKNCFQRNLVILLFIVFRN